MKLFFTLMFFCMTGLSVITSSPQALLQESQTRFNQGQYESALQALKSLNIARDFDNSEDMLIAFKIKAISLAQQDKLEQAKEIIRELLFIDPDYKFDPFDTPTLVLKLAQSEGQQIAEKNKSIAIARDQVTSLVNPPIIEKVVVVEKKPNFLVSFLPFGFNHYYLGSKTKGSIYLSLQAASLLTNITAYWWKQSCLESFGSNRLSDISKRSHFSIAQQTQYIALGTLVAALTVSIIDALIFFPSDQNSTGNL